MSPFTFSIISSLILSILLVVFQTSLQISLIRKLFCGINKNRLSQLTLSQKAVQISAISCYGFGSLAGISLIILRIHELSNGTITNYFSTIYQICHSLYLIFFAMAFIAAYVFMFTRTYATFEDSPYELKKITTCIHIGIAIVCILAEFSLITMVKLKTFDAAILDQCFGIFTILPLCAQIHLIFLFNYRLFKLALDERQSIDSSDTDRTGLSEKQMIMLSVVRKHTVLGVCIILFLFGLMINYTMAVYVYGESENQSDPRVVYPHYITLSTYLNSTQYMVIFDIINVLLCNMITLSAYLGFSVNKQYYTLFCNYIDVKCKRLCESLARRKLQSKNYRSVIVTVPMETAHI